MQSMLDLSLNKRDRTGMAQSLKVTGYRMNDQDSITDRDRQFPFPILRAKRTERESVHTFPTRMSGALGLLPSLLHPFVVWSLSTEDTLILLSIILKMIKIFQLCGPYTNPWVTGYEM
jgi:hypothetical protein